jgi:uncharacterized protein
LNGQPPAGAATSAVPLVDHHAHSVVPEVRDRATFESFLSEGGTAPARGGSAFCSFLGASLLRTCAPVLGLAPSASAEAYLTCRTELGGEEVNRRLLRAAHTDELLIDHGFREDDLLSPRELSLLAATPVRLVVRLERLAETIASEGVGATAFSDRFAEGLSGALSGPGAAVGCKSVLAYRHGLDVDPREPSPADVREAAAEWLTTGRPPENGRISHPVLLRHLVWTALRTGLPLQFHTGYGDPDLELHRSNPALLTGLIRLAAPLGAPIMLLHCYPYHREAAYLAAVYPDVYFDIGLAINYVGYRAAAVLAEALEAAPFHKMLYSSDAFGLAELHLMAAANFRHALGQALEPLATREARSEEEVARAAAMIGAGNARRIYQLPAGEAH